MDSLRPAGISAPFHRACPVAVPLFTRFSQLEAATLVCSNQIPGAPLVPHLDRLDGKVIEENSLHAMWFTANHDSGVAATGSEGYSERVTRLFFHSPGDVERSSAFANGRRRREYRYHESFLCD